MLVSVPLHHGVGAGTIHGAVSFGNTLILMRRYEPEAALAAISTRSVTFWFAVPTLFKRMAALPEATFDRDDLSSIRSRMTGTIPVPFDLKTWIIDLFGACLTEEYGRTEPA